MEWIEKLNPNLVLATYIKMNKVNWRVYETKDNPYVGAHIREVNRQAEAAARPAEVDGGDYSPANESKSARNIFLESYCGTVVY